MGEERGDARESAGTTITLGDTEEAHGVLSGIWRVEIFDADGVLQWDETLGNLITTQGGTDILAIYAAGTSNAIYASAFTAGSPGTNATYGAPIVTEVTTIQLANRVLISFGAAAARAIVGTAALPILSNTTITGIMAMKGGSGITTPGNIAAAGGVLLSEGALGTSQVISTTGTVNLSYTLSV
jgi:hypothetical protein